MKKLLLLALFLMPTMTLASLDTSNRLTDTPATELRYDTIKPVDLEPVRIRPIKPAPSETPSGTGGGGYVDRSPKLTSRIIQQDFLPKTTYQFLTGQFGFAYFESLTGERIYEMDYATYHTIDTKGKGTIYFVQVDKNGYEWEALKVLEIE